MEATMELRETQGFDYYHLDSDTAHFLKQKEINVLGIATRTYSELGKELKEVQELLAKHGYGCFEEWYTSLGLKKQSVYNYINYYNLIVQRLDERELIEGLPKPLAYEIAKPSAPEDLKQKVLSGDITTTKEYQEEVKARKAAEKVAAEAEARTANLAAEVERLAEDNAELLKANKDLATANEPEVIEKPVEVIPPEVESELGRLKAENTKLQNKNLQLEARLCTSQMDPTDRLKKARLDQKALDEEFLWLNSRIKTFLKEVAPYIYVSDSLLSMKPSQVKEHEGTLRKLEEWISTMKRAMPCGGEVIDVKGVAING